MNQKMNLIYNIFLIVFVLTSTNISRTALAGEWFVEADQTNIGIKLSYGNGSESYSISPSRVKLGYIMDDSVSVELHILTGGSDTDTDLFGTTFQMKTGNSSGIFTSMYSAKKRAFLTVGFQNFATRYTSLSSGTTNADNIFTLAIGGGAQLNIVHHLWVNIDYMYYFGSADYPSWFPGKGPKFSASGLSAGIKYIF